MASSTLPQTSDGTAAADPDCGPVHLHEFAARLGKYRQERIAKAVERFRLLTILKSETIFDY
jgi:hypothetical protein